MRPKFAGFWIRAVAETIDSTLLSVLTFFLSIGLMAVLVKVGLAENPGDKPWWAGANGMIFQVLLTAFYTLLALPYYIYGHYRYATTLGKRPLGVYVVNHGDLKPITMRQSVIRCLMYAPSSIFGVGYLMAAFHPEKRALHDVIAGTVSIVRRGKA